MAKYGAKAQSKVKRAMHERKHGTLRSGRSGKKVTSRKQAIAIGLSEARRAGGKVPREDNTEDAFAQQRERSHMRGGRPCARFHRRCDAPRVVGCAERGDVEGRGEAAARCG